MSVSVSVSVSVSDEKSIYTVRKSEVLFRLHQFPYPYPNQCHPIPVHPVSIKPPTVKNWYGRPILSVSGPKTCAVAIHSGILVYFPRERTRVEASKMPKSSILIDSQTETLINLVRERPYLYNSRDPANLSTISMKML